MATVVGMTKAAIEQYVQQQIGILAPADHAHNDQVNEMIVPGHGISKQYSEASGKLTLKAYIGTPVIVSETQPTETDVFWIDPSDQENLDRKIFGVGFPLGVVSAPPGWEYLDEAGTNGAWRWLKKSGTGNTGWEVVHGDTGWRNISTLLSTEFRTAFPNAEAYIRRADHVVELTVQNGHGAVGPAKLYTNFLNIPDGFDMGNSRRQIGSLPLNMGTGAMNTDGTSLYCNDGSSFNGRWTLTATAIHLTSLFDINKYPHKAWPTTLPGTAA